MPTGDLSYWFQGIPWQGLKSAGEGTLTYWFQGIPYQFLMAGGSAVLSGTVTEDIVESDIVAGGKTIILTLTGDTWIPE